MLAGGVVLVPGGRFSGLARCGTLSVGACTGAATETAGAAAGPVAALTAAGAGFAASGPALTAAGAGLTAPGAGPDTGPAASA